MRKGYQWANETYRLTFKDGKTVKENKACYSALPRISYGRLDKIKIYRTKCDKTVEYRDEYLQYVVDMLKLDAKIGKDSIEFKAFDCNTKNMLVCSIFRLLWEKIGYKTPAVQTHAVFLEPLLRSGKSKYRNKLKRFCDFYKRTLSPAGKRYWHCGHSWNPEDTEIKSTQDFMAKDRLISVNEFFTE